MGNLVKQRQFKYYIIYETVNKINHKVYVGCHATDDLDDGYLGSGKLLKEAILKYGKINFERKILYIAASAEEMFEIEASIVSEGFVQRSDTYNLVPGGFGGFKIQDLDDWKEKLKQSRKGKTPALGLKHSDETKQKMSESRLGRASWNKGLPGTWLGKTHTEESKKKISESKKGQSAGNKNPMYGKSAVKGRKWYNDGENVFYIFPDDPRIPQLQKGRLKPVVPRKS